MQKKSFAIGAIIAGALLCAPAFASDDKGKNYSYDKSKYKEHYEQRHQMNMDMMDTLKETMTILRDINHTPSKADKEKLNEMINRIDKLQKQHAEMGERAMKRRDMHHERMNEGRDNDRNGDRDDRD